MPRCQYFGKKESSDTSIYNPGYENCGNCEHWVHADGRCRMEYLFKLERLSDGVLRVRFKEGTE